MDDNTLKLLEYDRLLDLLAGLAQSEPGADFCLALQPDLTLPEARQNWLLIDEAKRITLLEGAPPLGDLVDASIILKRLRLDGMVLRPLELLVLLKVIRTSRLVKGFLWPLDTPLLKELALELPVLSNLEQALDRSFGPEGEVLDTASPELGRVRRELTGLRGAIQTKLSGLMKTGLARQAVRDDIVTRRAGRYVIPVKVSLVRDIPGLVHDYSASGATAFVEPLEMVEDNNRLNYLRRREKQEIEKVLADLSRQAALAGDQIASAGPLLAKLDAIFAEAALSRRQKARGPWIEPDKGVNFIQARHPLLLAMEEKTERRTTPIDLKIDAGARVLVISGINAGGKTVALKTLGLLVLMARAGLHLPVAEDSYMPYFDRVLASIGDEQDIQSDLSTFSGHVRRLGWILAESGDNSLILLDELGTGTDPAEGAALALAVLDKLRQGGSWAAAATHYHLLKAWARLTEGAENAAVRVDSQGRPTYGLDYGAPGFSAGLAMARKLGLAEEVVAKAEEYLDEGQKKTLDLMQRLEEERAALSESRKNCEEMEEQLSLARARQSLAENKRTEEFKIKLKTMRKEVDQAIAKAERDFRDIVRKLKNKESPGPLTTEFYQAKQELNQAVEFTPAVSEPFKNAKPGDRVMVDSLGREGTVSLVNEAKGLAEVEVDGLKVKAKLDDLAMPGRTRAKKRETTILIGRPEPPGQLNLLGMTVDEALSVVEKSLLEAYVGGLKQFAIIHGVGTGRLRRAVRWFLKEDARVKDFYHPEQRAGGHGVTLVELKE